MKDSQKPLSPGMISSSKSVRAFEPMILQTKEELLVAMKNGQLRTSKYNLLNDQEKMFVELVCFGGYTGEQAVKVITPGCHSATAIANRMLANPNVVETMNELTVAKDRKFAAEISSAKDMALAKLQYIMTTTDDPALAASCAKTILDKAEVYTKQAEKKDDEPIGQVKFNIQVENLYTGNAPKTMKPDEPVIIELTPEDIDGSEEIKDIVEKKAPVKTEVNPETGLPFVLHYEGVDNYSDEEKD